jgi:hypothetical protein
MTLFWSFLLALLSSFAGAPLWAVIVIFYALFIVLEILFPWEVRSG